jgi:peroxiredoxin
MNGVVMTKTSQQPLSTSRKPKHRSPWRWVGFAVAPLALAILVAVSTVSETEDATVEQAIPFELTATDGQTISLDESLAEGDALLYFSMGVGCDGCFAQIPELEAGMAERGIDLLPIMVDPAPKVASEAARFGIEGPILIDPGAQVSAAYGMVGIYGHGDRPSHSFALVRQGGEIAWVRHYAEMFVPAGSLLDELDAALEL